MKAGMQFAGLLAALALSIPGHAQEWQPYPQPKITVKEWQSYLLQVRERLEQSAEIYRDQGLVVFSNPDTRTFYIFTTKDNPAHPAWITRQLVQEKGEVNVRQIGFFAGNAEAFDKMFRDYLQRNEELLKEVEKRNQ